MGNMTTHRESTTGMSIESSTKTSNSDSVGSSESSSENGLPQEIIGLGILNPITDETKPVSEVSEEEESSSSKGKNMILGQELKINNTSSSSSHLNESLGGSDANSEVAEASLPKSPPKDKINSHLEPSLGSKLEPSLLPIPTGPSYDIPVSITASEILLSEDYTRVIYYGPNPKITHTFYDFSLECHPKHLIISFGKKREIMSVFRQESRGSDSCSSREFLNFCDACNKKLKEGEDIYRYRGESSFCSSECLAVGILAEEITKAAKESSHGPSVFLMDQEALPPYPKGFHVR